MRAMAKPTSYLCLAAFALLVTMGCGPDENSPEMGAVAPKPNPDVINNLPQDVKDRMQSQGADPQADAMAKAAAARKSGQ